jgi:hypothetical protein
MHRNLQLKSSLLDRIDFSPRRIGKTEHRQHLFPFTEKFVESFFRERRLPDQDDSQGCASFPIRSG